MGDAKDKKNLVADGYTPKELYEQAEDKVRAGSIEQAIDHYKIILASYPGSKYAIQARLDIAYNLLKQKKYKRAILELDAFIDKYPNLNATAYAYYLKGVAAEESSSSILDEVITDSAQRDVQSVKQAYSFYSTLIEKFPNSKYSKVAAKKLPLIVNTLARHEFYVAIYYTRIDGFIAALNRTKFIVENYPNSASIPDSLHLMAYNYDRINLNKLAKDTRSVLELNHPNYEPNYSLK
jgi:outer membrane protein assembly factor BamD